MAAHPDDLLQIIAEQQAMLNRLNTEMQSLRLETDREKLAKLEAEKRALEVKQQEIAKQQSMLKQLALEKEREKDRARAHARSVDSNGDTPLHQACREGNIPLINKLVRDGGDINAVNHKGFRPLDFARARGYTQNVGRPKPPEQLQAETDAVMDLVFVVIEHGGIGKNTQPYMLEKHPQLRGPHHAVTPQGIAQFEQQQAKAKSLLKL